MHIPTILTLLIDAPTANSTAVYVSICVSVLSALATLLGFSAHVGRLTENFKLTAQQQAKDIQILRADMARSDAEHMKEIEFLHAEHHQYLHEVIKLASEFSRDLGKVEGQLVRMNGKSHGGT